MDFVNLSGLCFAYLDPGNTNMLLPTVLGALGSVVVVLKLYWRSMLAFLGFRRWKAESRGATGTHRGRYKPQSGSRAGGKSR